MASVQVRDAANLTRATATFGTFPSGLTLVDGPQNVPSSGVGAGRVW